MPTTDKIKPIPFHYRALLSLLMSNCGIALISYAGFRMGSWNNETAWRIMMADGIWFCFGALVNFIIGMVQNID